MHDACNFVSCEMYAYHEFLVVLHLQTPSGELDQGDKGLTKHLGCCCLIAVYASYLGKPNDTSKGYIFNNVQSKKNF